MTDLLSGQLGYTFILSIVDAVILAAALIWWYRRSLSILMRQSGSSVARPAPVPRVPVPTWATVDAQTAAPLTFAVHDHALAAAASVLSAGVARTRLLAAYGAGAALHAALMTVLQLGTDPSAHLPPLWFATWCIGLWPLVPTVVMLLVLDRASGIGMVAGFVAANAVGVVLVTLAGQITRGHFSSAPFTNAFWLTDMLAVTVFFPMVLVALTVWRRVRAVMPLVFATTLVFGMTLAVVREGLNAVFNDPRGRVLLLDATTFTSARVVYYGLFLLAALPVGVVALWMLRRLASAFERHRFSDVQLVIDCCWVVATAEQVSSTLALRLGWHAIPAGALAFVLYRVTVAVVLRAWQPTADPNAPRLLLLRVFGHQARTEALFDRIAQRWRFRGPVQLIAGVDLAGRTIDPSETLAFISGRLRDRYVATVESIPSHLAGLAARIDPDARYRVNGLYCRADTWQATLEALLDVSDRVLIDLRSFDETNAGCIFELRTLMARVPTGRLVIISDHTTNLDLTKRVLTEAWASARAQGVARGAGEITIVPVERQSRADVRLVLSRLARG